MNVVVVDEVIAQRCCAGREVDEFPGTSLTQLLGAKGDWIQFVEFSPLPSRDRKFLRRYFNSKFVLSRVEVPQMHLQRLDLT